MKSTIKILAMILANVAFGQAEQASYKVVADNFEKNYNADDFNAIFSTFSAEMQSAATG